MNRYDVGIIGGGVSGLIAAYELVKKNKRVILFEKSKELGGVIRPFSVKGYDIEGTYHQIFEYDKYIFKLAKELGVKIGFRQVKIGYNYGSRTYNLSKGIDILRFDKLSMLNKIRLVRFMLKIMLIRDISIYDDIRVKEWVTQHTGKEVYHFFFEPLLKAKFGDNSDKISAAWLIGRIKLRLGGLFKSESLGYPENGFKDLFDKLEIFISKNGCKIKKGCEVKKITIKDKHVYSVNCSKEDIRVRSIISTVSPSSLRRLIKAEDYIKRLSLLEFQGSICVILGLKNSLTKYFWINVMKKKYYFNALIEHTNFQPIYKYKEHIIYLASYPERNSKLWKLDDKEVFNKYISSLKELYPIFNEKEINWYRVFKEEAGLIYKKGLLKNIPSLKSPIKGLFVCGMMCGYPDREIERMAKISKRCVNLCDEYLTSYHILNSWYSS